MTFIYYSNGGDDIYTYEILERDPIDNSKKL